MVLIEGTDYYIMSDETHFSEIDKEHFETFKKHNFIGSRFFSSGHVSNVYVSYMFSTYTKLPNTIIELNEDQKEQKVFKDQDDILKYLVRHVANLGVPYRLDEYLQVRVMKSQKDYPEKWI